MAEALAVLDVGKTHTKLSLIGRDGRAIATRSRANVPSVQDGIQVLDTDGIETWLTSALAELSSQAEIIAIAPVGHGAAAALIVDGSLAAPVLDYEAEPPAEVTYAYRELTDPFARTLSPHLPLGLNLGLQLYWQERLYPSLWPSRADVLLWPQYWAWRLSGAMASEVTSLGCHTDLWLPYEKSFSDLARTRGWSTRFPPLKHARAVLGNVRATLTEQTGLSPTCKVLCGLHDSNASLVAARGFEGLSGAPFALVSTGTWFVSLQSGQQKRPRLDAARDTLANVDVEGKPTPSARFMGGREYAAICGEALGSPATLADAARVVTRGTTTRPSFVSGSGPFPNAPGAIVGCLESDAERVALASLHLAMMTHTSLGLVSAEGPILIEGRFAADPIFPAALASLRLGKTVLRCALGDGVALGAARLFWPSLSLGAEPVEPLPFGLERYRETWERGAG